MMLPTEWKYTLAVDSEFQVAAETEDCLEDEKGQKTENALDKINCETLLKKPQVQTVNLYTQN